MWHTFKNIPSSQKILTILFFLAFGYSTALSECDDGIEEKLNLMYKPWTTPVEKPDLEELTTVLDHWAAKYPQIFSYEAREHTPDGLPVLLVKITDESIPDDDKQVVLVTSFHAGAEQTGGTAALNIINFMLGNTDTAQETRQKQIVLIMPFTNPWGYFGRESMGNVNGIDPYTGSNQWIIGDLTLKDPDKTPELKAYISVSDEFRPEIHLDLHGVALRYNGALVHPNVGSAASNHSLRPWDWRFTEDIIAAGQLEGHSYDRLEVDAQRLLWGPSLNGISDVLHYGRPRFYSAMYSYHKYHTLPFVSEVGWEEGVVAFFKGVLAIGNQERGYPVNVIKSCDSSFRVCSYGLTAEDTRNSRVELWGRQWGISMGELAPYTDCRFMSVACTTPNGANAIGAQNQTGYATINTSTFIDNINAISYMNSDAIESFINVGPVQQNEITMDFGSNDLFYSTAVEHGLTLRQTIYYPNPEILDIRLNGHQLPVSSVDGYQVWSENGSTQIQVNIPPNKTITQEVFIITCAYKPTVQRSYGWRTPDIVKQRLND